MNIQTADEGREHSWWRRRWPWLMVATLLLAGCGAWVGLGAWLVAPFTPFMANRLSYVQGKSEVIAPAQWNPGGILSPDGRWMVIGWTKEGKRERVVWNLVSGEQYPFTLNTSALCWLNPEQFAVLNAASMTYYLVQAQDAVPTVATLIVAKEQYGGPNDLAQLRTRWQAAEQVYMLENFLYAGYTIFTLEEGKLYAYFNFVSDSEIDKLTDTIPHVRLPIRCNNPTEGVPVYSPDGRFYTQLSHGENAHVLIYSREGELVAEAAKTGWDPRLMGWAHDSSGVYFQMLISGGGASVLVPYEPIFKLSPLTEEEARWAPVWSGLKWACGLVVIAIGGWLWWRRKRSRAT